MSGEMSFYDIHSHVLPGMDDGAKDVNASLAMLAESKKQGCLGIVTTSHYYRRESIASFLQRRQESYEELMQAVGKKDPFWKGRIALGAEVAYHHSLVFDEDLPRLCFGKSDYLLLEPPFTAWSSTFLRDVQRMVSTLGLKVIIAHLERYRSYADKRALNALLSMDVMIQMDAEELLQRGPVRRAVSMIRKGMVDLLGSDMHNTTSRPQTMGQALVNLANSRAEQEISRILQNSKAVYTEAIG